MNGANEQAELTTWSAAMIHASSDLGSIRELNLSYLMLARRVLASDREAAQSHLGLSAEMADTAAQALAVANREARVVVSVVVLFSHERRCNARGPGWSQQRSFDLGRHE